MQFQTGSGIGRVPPFQGGGKYAVRITQACARGLASAWAITLRAYSPRVWRGAVLRHRLRYDSVKLWVSIFRGLILRRGWPKVPELGAVV